MRKVRAIVLNNLGDEMIVTLTRKAHCSLTCLNSAAIRRALAHGLPESGWDVDETGVRYTVTWLEN